MSFHDTKMVKYILKPTKVVSKRQKIFLHRIGLPYSEMQ